LSALSIGRSTLTCTATRSWLRRHEKIRRDVIVTPNIGVTCSGSKKKLAEHGGFLHDDTNVIMMLAIPSISAGTVTSPVETTQIAPTILSVLGLDPGKLTAVQAEGTQAPPGLDFGQSH
jgi:hypothetical protein